MSRRPTDGPTPFYLDEVRNCDLYLGLFGDDYGWENKDGLSPTHLEYNEATRLGKTRLIFVKGMTDESKHPKMQALIREVSSHLVRRRLYLAAACCVVLTGVITVLRGLGFLTIPYAWAGHGCVWCS